MKQTETKKSTGKYISYALVLAAGICWGCTGLFNRHLTVLGFTSTGTVILRNIGSAVLLALVLLITDRSLFRIRVRHLPYFLGTGIISLLIFTLCYFRSQQINSLALAAIMMYTAPAFVVLLSVPVFRDKITGKKLLALAVAFGGCVLASGLAGGRLELTAEGLLLGLGSGLFYASYSIFARMAMKHYRSLTITFYTFAVAAAGSLLLLALGAADYGAAVWTGGALWNIAGLLLIGTVAPYILYTKGLEGIGDGGKASILASIEPVMAAFVGVLAFGEPLGPGTIGGLVCILISVFILR